jgi:hypothetical protein
METTTKASQELMAVCVAPQIGLESINVTDLERLDLAIDSIEKLGESLREFRKEIAGITKLRQEHADLAADLARIRQILEAA